MASKEFSSTVGNTAASRSRPAGGATPPLHGYTVVDLSAGIAGAYCTKLLADGGADVVLLEPPDGHPLRSWSASGADIAPGADGALFSFLSCSKNSVLVDPGHDGDLDLAEQLFAAADAVIWSSGSPVADHPQLAPAEVRRRHPHLVVTAISPFGLDGPWRDRPATEFTLQAWSGGIVGLGRGSPEKAPVHVGGRIGEWFAGAYASVATMTARLRTFGTGIGELVDLAMLETQILGLTYFPVSFYEVLGRPFRTQRKLSVPGVASAADGLIALGCGTAQQWFDLCAMVGHPEWIDESGSLSITERTNQLAPEINRWLAEHTVAEVRELATAFRIPNGPVATGANVAELDHHEARQFFTTNPRDGFVQPGPPYRFSTELLRTPQPAPRLGQHTERYRAAASPKPHPGMGTRPTVADLAESSVEELPFRNLRVLDMTTFWAGPSCTHFLALLGAEVIHVESTARPDGTRLIAGVPTSENQWWEQSPIYGGLNTNKKGITVDFRTERGRELLRTLIASCDVVVENYTPRVLEEIGLDYAAVRALRDDIIMVRMPGFGLQGPWRDHPAFAYVIEDVSGLSWLTGHPEQNPVEPYSIGDPGAGIHAVNATLLALEHRRRTGQGSSIEAAMVDAALNMTAEQVIEYSAYGCVLQRSGNRGPSGAPQNLYRSADIDEFGRADYWVAIAVETDEQWSGLCTALGNPTWATDPALAHHRGRQLALDRIDEQLAEWCAPRDADDIVHTLCDAGVPAAPVLQPHRQAEIPQIDFRGFFEDVAHPVNATAKHSTIAARFSGGPEQFHRRHAPLLGQDNTEVLRGIGCTDAEIAQLADDGVIGTVPTLYDAARK